MATAEEVFRRLMAGGNENLDQLSNNELRRLGFIVAAELPVAAERAEDSRSERRKAIVDATGFSFTISFEAVSVAIGAVLPPPFNIALIGGAVLSGGYKFYDGRSKYRRLIGAWRSNARQRTEARRLKRVAIQLEAEVRLRMATGKWP